MKAVVYDGTRRVAVHQVPDAVVEDPGDVVIRVTSSAICGTDLHMYDGRTGAERGLVLGHEPVGTVQEVGGAVTLLERGERVVPTHLFCGLCFNCIRGETTGPRCSTRACRSASAAPTTAVTLPDCGTWSSRAAPGPAASSPTMAAWRMRRACMSASTGAPPE